MPSEQPPTRVEEAARALDKVIWLTDDVPHEVLVPARELHEALLNEPDKPALAQPQPREGSYNEQADRVFSEQPRGEGGDLAARLEEKARAESDEFGNYHDRYAEGPALPEPPRIESAPARVETEDIERLRDVVDRFDDGVGMNYLYVESLGRILDSLGDLTYKDLAEVDEIVIERGKTSGPEAFSWATPPKGGFDPRHDASRGPDRPASPSQPIEQANCPESTQKNLPAAPPDPQPSEPDDWRNDEEAQALIDAIKGEPASEQPTREGDDLASRLDERAELWERKGGLGANIAAGAYRQAAEMARASTHPEQSAQVDPEQLRLVRNMAKIEASQSDPEQAPAFTDERRASHRRRADALNAVLAALEPASPTPTEQENDR